MKLGIEIASFRRKIKTGGEPGLASHMISRHVDVTAIIAKVVTQLCSHVMADSNSYDICY